MEGELVARLRANPGVASSTGVFGTRPAVDLGERKSNAPEAFPAAVVTKVFGGGQYDQDGPGRLRFNRMRVECFGLSYGAAKDLAKAVEACLEVADVIGSVRFHRGKLEIARDMAPEDVAKLRIFRTVLDFQLPTTNT